MNVQTAISIIHAIKDIAFALIGAVVFIYGIVHSIPLTQTGVEYVGVFASYYGVHTGTTKITDKAMATATGQQPK